MATHEQLEAIINERRERRYFTGTPPVGELATYVIGTDRYPYTVIEVSASGHRVTLQKRKSRRVDNNGLSENQRWISVEDKDGDTMVVTRRKDGGYRPKGSKAGHVMFGEANSYLDPHF